MSAVLQHCWKAWTERAFNPATWDFATIFWPSIAYWSACVLYDVLDRIPSAFLDRYRLKRVKPGRSNDMSRSHVILRVMMLHGLQVVMGMITTAADPEFCDGRREPGGWPGVVSQVILAMLVMDTWQFWIHRWMHINTTLYKMFHSTHHRLLVPYSYGALYNHPAESFLLDTLGAIVTIYVANLSCSVAAPFLAFASIKTVLDHCGYRFPINPLHDLFPNSAAYHDVHHDVRHIKKNFSQPFFTHWDVLMGSWVDPKAAHFHLTPSEAKAESCVAHSMAVDPRHRVGDSSESASSDDDEAAAAAARPAPAAPAPAAEAPAAASPPTSPRRSPRISPSKAPAPQPIGGEESDDEPSAGKPRRRVRA